MLDSRSARGLHLGVGTVCLSFIFIVMLSYLAAQGVLPSFAAKLAAFLTSCPHRMITGSPCPFCGVTTAALLLLRGALMESVQAHPLAAVGLPLLVTQLLYRAYRTFRPVFSIKEELLLLGVPLVAGGAVLLSAVM